MTDFSSDSHPNLGVQLVNSFVSPKASCPSLPGPRSKPFRCSGLLSGFCDICPDQHRTSLAIGLYIPSNLTSVTSNLCQAQEVPPSEVAPQDLHSRLCNDRPDEERPPGGAREARAQVRDCNGAAGGLERAALAKGQNKGGGQDGREGR